MGKELSWIMYTNFEKFLQIIDYVSTICTTSGLLQENISNSVYIAFMLLCAISGHNV